MLETAAGKPGEACWSWSLLLEDWNYYYRSHNENHLIGSQCRALKRSPIRAAPLDNTYNSKKQKSSSLEEKSLFSHFSCCCNNNKNVQNEAFKSTLSPHQNGGPPSSWLQNRKSSKSAFAGTNHCVQN